MIEKELAKFTLDQNNKIAIIDFYPEAIKDYSHIPQLLDEFSEQCARIDDDSDLEILVIRSGRSGQGLCFHSYVQQELDVRIISKWEKIVTQIERLRKATLVVMQGEVSESMLQLALVCDHRICLPDTSFRFTAIRSGYLPGMAVFRIAKFIGLGHAKQMLFTGEDVSARKACELGIIDEIVDDLEQGISDFRSLIHPKQLEAILMARRLLNESFSMSYEDEIGSYLAAQMRCLDHLKKKTTA